MNKKTNKLIIYSVLFGGALITSNAIASKLWDTGLTLFGMNISFTVGCIVYPLTFLITDIISQNYGREYSKSVVKGGFIIQIISMIMIWLAGLLPSVSIETQNAYQVMFSNTFWLVLASLTAYLISQRADVLFFDKIKQKINNDKYRILYSILSTTCSQLIDSIMYATIAFGIGFGWLWNGNVLMLLNMILAQFLLKTILAVVVSPIYMFFTKKGEK